MITEKQREERRSGLGGSDIAAIIPKPGSKTGVVSPWKTPAQVWESKVCPALDDTSESEAMWWGSNEEDLVARRFSMVTGKRVVNHNFMIHDDCLIANLDRLIVPEGAKIAAYQGQIRTTELFEAKTGGEDWAAAEAIEELPNGFQVLDGSVGIPEHYLTQGYHYLGRVPGAEKIYFGVKLAIPCGRFSRTEFRVYVLKRDDEIIAAQDAFARAWWKAFVVGGKRPEPVCEEDCKILWRRSVPKTSITLDTRCFEAWRDLKAAKAMVAQAEEMESKAKQTLKAALGENEAILGPDGKTEFATWKSAKDKVRAVTDWETLARSFNPTESEIAAVNTTWETLARSKGATDEQIKAATTETVKPGNRTFLIKLTDKVDKAAKEIEDGKFVLSLPEPTAEVA